MAATSSSYHLLNHISRTPPSSSAFRSFLFRRSFTAKCCLSPSSTFAPLLAVNLLNCSSRRVSTTRSVGVSSSSSVNVRVHELIHDKDGEEYSESEDEIDGYGDNEVVEEEVNVNVKPVQELIHDEEETEEEEDSEFEDEIDGDGGNEVVEQEVKVKPVDRSKLPKLTIKEKKELASYAHSLGKKLKVQLVGKSGVTASLASSFVETLEANELLKIKIHSTCPAEVPDVAKQLEDATGSVVVGQIGRTIILYRPSISKMKAEEKRRQVRKVFVRKETAFKPAFPKKGGIPRPAEQTPRPNRRGTRGTSRMTTAE